MKFHKSGFALAIAMVILMAAACDLPTAAPASTDTGSSTVKVTALLNTESGAVTLGTTKTYSLNYTLLPGDATNTAIDWTSSDEGIATVDSSGTVTGVSAGSATVTGTTQDGGFTADFTVDVVTYVAVTGLSITIDIPSIEVNDGSYMTADFTPVDATNQALTYSSSNEAVATVDSDGYIIGTGGGTATIRATSVDNPGVYGEDVITVIADTTAPSIQLAIFNDSSHIYMYYDEVMNASSMTDVNSYTFSNGPAGLSAQPTAATAVDSQSVILTLSQAMNIGDSLDVASVATDAAGNACTDVYPGVLYGDPPPAADPTKISIVNGKISGLAGAVSDGAENSNDVIVILPEGVAFNMADVVSAAPVDVDGSFSEAIDLNTYEVKIHNNGNYDIYVMDADNILSSKITVTVINGL